MVSNYVKKGYVSAPVKKQYSSEQLGRLLILAIGKNVLPLDSLSLLLSRWDQSGDSFEQRYDSYCDDFEAVLRSVLDDRPLQEGCVTGRLMHSMNVAAANVILLNLSLTSNEGAD